MNYRPLGTTGINISEIGFGCMSLPSREEKESINLLQKAYDLGINYFDTADLYDKGQNEIIVGKAFKVIRDKVIIATKVGNQWRSDGSGWDWNPSKEYILRSVEGSLKRLQTDHIDLYQLHGGTIDDPIDDSIEAFEILKKNGKILHYGISSIRPNVIIEYIKRSSIASVMMQYSLADRRPEEDILDILLKHNISVLVRGALAQGLLINKPPKDYLGYTTEEMTILNKTILDVSDFNRTPAQTAIQYVLQHPSVASAIVGVRTKQQLDEVVKEVNALTEEELRSLKKAAAPNRYEQHRIDHQPN
jgi:aryl-alcohol dehydrogenase-like predicted oxidoreductase